MPFSRLLRRFSQPTLARSDPTDADVSTSDGSNIPRRGRQASESIAIIRRPWKAKRPSSTEHSSPSQPTPTSPLTFNANGPKTESGVDEIVPPVPAIPSALLTNVAVMPSPEMVPVIGPVPDNLADAWDAVEDDPKIANTSRELDTVGVCSAPSFFLLYADPGL
jgi:hypothetical protein